MKWEITELGSVVTINAYKQGFHLSLYAGCHHMHPFGSVLVQYPLILF